MECQAALKALDQLKSCFFSLRVETYHSIFPLKQWVCPGTVRINVMAINDSYLASEEHLFKQKAQMKCMSHKKH